MPIHKGGTGKGMGVESVKSTVRSLEINNSKRSNSAKPSRSGGDAPGAKGFARGPRTGSK